MTGLDIFLMVVLLGTAGALGLFVQRWQQERRRVAEQALLIAQYQPVVQAVPELEQRLRYYQAIAETVPHKDAQLQRYAPIQNLEAHLQTLLAQQRQWEQHLQSLEQQHRDRQAAHQATLQQQQFETNQRRQVIEHEFRTQENLHKVTLQVQREQGEVQLRSLQKQQQKMATAIAILEGKAAAFDVGLAGPRYDFREAVEYKNKLDQLRSEQEVMVKLEKAAVCTSEWTINGDRKAGKKTTDAILKLMLRAFNGESDALVGRVRYDNLDSYKAKLVRSSEAINKLGGGFNCALTPAYVQLKVQELELVNAYQNKLTSEREEQRAIKEQMRDEQRAAQEIEKAEREAEQSAEKFQAALDKARREITDTEGAKQQKLLGQIQELERKLKEAEEKRTRALSMAQQTRAGHVYVISNVGSFGEGVFKIGMTRRLEPQDRVDELGDASVPFRFDVHAMIYTTDAPRLEKVLHDLFADRRVNKINPRKEFFHVTLDEIETAVAKHHGEFKLTKLAEAEEYRRGLVVAEPLQTAAA